MDQDKVFYERLLREAGVVDMETGYLLLFKRAQEEKHVAVTTHLQKLKHEKPFLFSSLKPNMHASPNELANRARSSMSKDELLRYLRARRGG